MVDKSPIGYKKGKPYVLDVKVPRNPKYANIGPTFSTGYNISNIKILSDKHIISRKSELFKRIKPSTVINLLKREKNTESIYNLLGTPDLASSLNKQEDRKIPTRGTINQSDYSYISQSKVSDTSKISGVTYGTTQLGINVRLDKTEFIIIDLREKEDYESYHIKEAFHFPGPAIARDKLSPELFNFKNKEDKLIIIYHQDERHGVPYANEFAEKGFENVYFISGGMDVFIQEAPDLIEGKKVPSPPKRSTKSNLLYKRSQYMQYPYEGNVIIPSNHALDDQNASYISRSTKQTGASNRARSIGPSLRSASKIL